VGILFAPKSGEETRGLIKDKAGEGADYLKRRTVELRDSAGDVVEKVKGSAGDMVEKSKSAINRQKDQLAAAVEAGKQAYREAVATSDLQSGPAGV
jgi:gas vesicle protein